MVWSGKGSLPRPRSVSKEQLDENWDRIERGNLARFIWETNPPREQIEGLRERGLMTPATIRQCPTWIRDALLELTKQELEELKSQVIRPEL